MTTVEKPFDPAFNYAFQPKQGPPDDWTAEIGGNNLECFIVKESLTIRMGKDDPELLNQADAGTASFEIRGEPLRPVHVEAPWNDNGGVFLGQWTDSPILKRHLRDELFGVLIWAPQPAQGTIDISNQTFAPHAWYDFTQAAGRDGTVTFTSPDDWVFRGDNDNNVIDPPFDWRIVVDIDSGQPWQQGTTLAERFTGPWTAYAAGTKAYTTPTFTFPANAWAVVQMEWRVRGSAQIVGPMGGQLPPMLTQTWGTGLRVHLDYAVPDIFEPGEKVVIKRNNLTIWTGWVTDTQREWAPSTGSVWTVNAAGPRAFYNRRKYVPRFGNVVGTDPNVAAFPHDIGHDGNMNWPLQYTVDELAPYFTMGVDWYLTSESQSLQTGTTFIYPGSDQFPVMELLDAAANCVFGQVWEKRDGKICIYGHAYYRFEGPPAWYVNDRVILNCDDIGAPVEIRNEPSYVNSWSAKCRLEVVGTPVGDNSTPPDPVIQEYYEPLTNQFLAVREYNISPIAPINEFHADVKWDFMRDVYSRNIESIDRWTVNKRFVDDAVWTDLLTMWLGWPVRITNIPDGVFLDGTTEFNGFLWGWELRGTEEIDLILVDQRLFK